MTYIPSGAYTVSATLASDVTDTSTFTVGYPSGTVQADFANGNYKAGSGRVILNGVDVWTDADPGFDFTTFGATTITLTNNTGATLAAGTEVLVSVEHWTVPAIHIVVPVLLVDVSAADVVTAMVPGVDGYITHIQWVQGTPVTTAGDGMDFNLEIGSTNVTGGVVALTSATATPLGVVIHGTRITAANRITKKDTLSLEAAAGAGVFAEGAGHFVITVRPDPV